MVRFISVEAFLALTLLITCCGSPVMTSGDRFEHADLIGDMASSMLTDNPDSAFALLREAKALQTDSVVVNYIDVLSSKFHYLRYQDDSCMALTESVSDWFRRQNPPTPDMYYVKGMASNVRGVCFQAENAQDEAEACFRNAADCLLRSGRCKGLPDVYVNLSNVLLHKGDFASAAYAAGRALQCTDSLGLDASKHSINVALAEIYARMGNYDKAGQYFGVAIEKYPPSSDYETFYCYNALCNYYFLQDRYEEALDAARKSYSAVLKTGQRPSMAVVEANFGDIFTRTGQLDSAKVWLDRSYDWFSRQGADDAALFYLYGLYASLYLQRGDVERARHYLSRPYDEKRVGPSYMYEHYKRLSEYCRKSGDWRRALYYTDKERAFDDSLRNLKHLNNVAEMSARYARDTTLMHQRAELADNRATIRSQRLTIIVTILLLVLCAGALAVTHAFFRRRRERHRQEELRLIRELRLQSARKLLSPHLLFNAINAVAPKDSTVSEHLVNIARFSVQMLDKNMVSLGDELQLSREYVSLHRAMHDDDPEVEWDLDPSAQSAASVPTLCIQTHVENALKYAGASHITVAVKRASAAIEISVKDDGAGYLNTVSAPGQGMGKGIQTMSRTIAVLNDGRMNKMKYDILSVAGKPGTEVRIIIPDEDKGNNNR